MTQDGTQQASPHEQRCYSPSNSNHQNCCSLINYHWWPWHSHGPIILKKTHFSHLLFNSFSQFIIGTNSFPLDPTSSPQYPTCPLAAHGHFVHQHMPTLQPTTTFPKPTSWELTPPPLSPMKKLKSKLAPYQVPTLTPWQQSFMPSSLPCVTSSPLYLTTNPTSMGHLDGWTSQIVCPYRFPT